MSLARAYVTLQASFLLLLGVLALLKTHRGTLCVLGWMWVVMACYLFSYHWLYVHEWAFLRDNGSYLIMSGAMLVIAFTTRLPKGHCPSLAHQSR